jgi:hypothetical protein
MIGNGPDANFQPYRHDGSRLKSGIRKKSTSLEDGCYILKVAYSNDKELILKILRFRKHIEVLALTQLRNVVIEQLKQELAK